jgi:thiol-disulfide isomerase/thioredoxin
MLLFAFTAAISLALARGARPACRCFGRVSARPVGWPTLARNALLMLVAASLLLAGPGTSLVPLVSWTTSLSVAERVAAGVAGLNLLLLAALGWLFVQLLQQNGRILMRLEGLNGQAGSGAAGRHLPPAPGLPVGSPAPVFVARDMEGRAHTLGELGDGGRPFLLVFSNPECGPCRALLPEVAAWQTDYAATVAVVLVSEGTPEANRGDVERAGVRRLWLQDGREVAEAFQAYGTPTAVLVERDGRIGAALAVGADAIRELLHSTVRARRSGGATTREAAVSVGEAEVSTG